MIKIANLLDLFITVGVKDEATGKLDDIAEAGTNVGKGLGEGSKTGGNWLEKLGSQGSASGDLISKAFSGAAAAVAGAFAVKKLAEFGAQCVSVASTAETAFAKVSTLLSDTDNSAYFDAIRKGSQETGVAITDYADAVYNALSASVDQAHAVEFTTSAIKLAKGGFTDATTAVDVLTTAINAYGMQAEDATAISDKLVTTQNLGKVTVGELAQNMGRSIPTARAYNVSLDTLCATYAVMTKNGNPAAESTTLLNAMLNELGKSGTKTATILKDKTGKSFSELMADGTSLTDVLGILGESAQQSGLSINDLFGSAEAAKGANILLNNAEDLNSAIKEMGSSSGATESAYGSMMDTMAEKTAKLKNNFELLKEKIGAAFLPIAEKGVDVINGLFDLASGNNQFKGQAASLEEATQKAAEYQQQIDAIYDSYEAGEDVSRADSIRINQLTAAMNSYREQAEAFKNGNAEIAESAADPAEKFQEATETYTAAAEQLMQTYLETYEQTLGSVQGWFGPFDKAATTVKTSLSEITSNMQSQIDFNNQYADNLQYLADNGLGSLSESLQAYGKDGAAYAATITEALEQAGGATTEQGQAIVQQFETLMTGIEESQSGLAENFTNMSGEFASQAEQIAQDYADMIDGLDKADEAGKAAQSTMDSFVSGLENGQSAAAEVCGKLAETMMSALQGKLGTVTIGIELVSGGASANGMVAFGPQKAIGMDYIPYNGMPAVLHRGEAILTSYEADQWRRGRSGGNGQGITIVQNISATPQTPAQFAATTEAYFQRARWAF